MATYLDGGMSARERDDVERHLAECRDCRDLLASAVAALDAPIVAEAPAARAPRWPRLLIPFAAAASIGIVMLARLEPSTARDYSPPVRSAPSDAPPADGLEALRVYSPSSGDTVVARGITFTWGGARAERYHLVLSNEEGVPLWRFDTSDTSVVLPDSVALQPGRLHFWHVDAVEGGVAATTRLLRFTTAPAP